MHKTKSKSHHKYQAYDYLQNKTWISNPSTPLLLARSLFGKLLTLTEWCWKSSFAFHSKVSQKLDYGVNYNYRLTISCDPQTRIANCNWYFEFVAQALSVNRECHDLTMHKRKIKSPVQVPGLLLTSTHIYEGWISNNSRGIFVLL